MRSSIRLTIFACLILATGVAAYLFMQPDVQYPDDSDPVPPVSFYSSEKYGLGFQYPDSYELTEHDAPGSALREHHTIVLMRKANLPAPEGGEGPPAITIEMFQNNLDKQTTEGWIRGTNDSNFKLSSDSIIASTTISGLPALSYRWSGLYEGTTIAVAQPNWLYAFSVTYLEPGADIVQDFVSIRDSVQLMADN